MYQFAVTIAAAASYQLETQHRQRLEQQEREAEAWEDEHLLPLMNAEQRTAFLAERKRLKERREDIARQERQHRELVAAQRSIARAVERRHSSVWPFALGFLLGELTD